MPHINIEYNDAIGKALNMKALIADLHDCAMSLEALPTGGIRTRGYLTDISNVGDAAAENGFIYITIRLGQGRNETVKKDIGPLIIRTWAMSGRAPKLILIQPQTRPTKPS